GNGLIISAVACGHHLHTPMFFFLLNLALSDLGSICTTVLLGSRACAHMAAAAWTSGFLTALLQTGNTFSLPLCHGNALGQFFCEIPHIPKLSCSHSTFRKIGISLRAVSLAFGCFVFMVFSYVQILRAVLRIPSVQGRHKSFSTCLPHLAMVSLFLSTAGFAYLKPLSVSSPSLDLAVSVLYSVVPPALNPLIYSLRNQELKAAVWTLAEETVLLVPVELLLGNDEDASPASGSAEEEISSAPSAPPPLASASTPPQAKTVPVQDGFGDGPEPAGTSGQPAADPTLSVIPSPVPASLPLLLLAVPAALLFSAAQPSMSASETALEPTACSSLDHPGPAAPEVAPDAGLSFRGPGGGVDDEAMGRMRDKPNAVQGKIALLEETIAGPCGTMQSIVTELDLVS
ncbi:olfactory receptor 14A16-like, partial [Ammospiza nelsoni]|uniref:olfactory receptor 14A16-like n=1 Tax=Ammospiza nelsoni TaxID=2857394 RepID=UPI00286A4113